MEEVYEGVMSLGTSFMWVLITFFSWTTLYFVLCVLNPRRSYEWHCRCVTVVHALTVTGMSAWCGFVQGPWPFTHPGGPVSPLQQMTCITCLGYFLFDIFWCLYFKTEGAMMLVHHMISILGTSMVLLLHICGTDIIAAIFGSEATNPFLQARWFLRQTGRHKSWYGELNDLVFMTLFGYLRLGVGSNLLYWHLHHPRPILPAKIGAVLFYMIGFIWMVQIIMYAMRKYKLMYRTWQQSKTVVYVDPDSSDVQAFLHPPESIPQSSNGEMNGNSHVIKRNIQMSNS